ncbi:hypothetical protein OG883_37195 [Streptomyces sp. NBC_01142]|uniref:hypothetical protein n=1 Tax=Streptomyces sp. NBC_01142 TaxID=2975865 RepID=UPI0022564BF4|nr:hypothetical protein [Streptomyces sp. NBC_01142]MCX4825394.1 hypothetical protein [Streptomyces sp. NBC_01142]
MRPHRHLGADIGLSGLIKWIRYPRVNSEAAGLDVVTSVADRFDGAFAHQLLQDCLVLLDSPLSSRDIEILWLAGTFREFDLERLGIDGRVWLRRIADICIDRIRRDDLSFTPAAAATVVDEAMREAVRAEVRSVGPAWSRPRPTTPTVRSMVSSRPCNRQWTSMRTSRSGCCSGP